MRTAIRDIFLMTGDAETTAKQKVAADDTAIIADVAHCSRGAGEDAKALRTRQPQ